MNFTVKDLAEYCKVNLKEMIHLLTEQAPEVNWTAKIPVPDSMVEAFMKNADDYKAASQPIGALASTNGEGADIAQMRVNNEAAQYAIMNALAECDRRDIITTAISHTLDEIETYESTKAQVWDKYVDAKLQANNQREQQQALNLKAQALRRQQGISSRMTKQQQQTQTAANGLKNAEDFLAQILGSI